MIAPTTKTGAPKKRCEDDADDRDSQERAKIVIIAVLAIAPDVGISAVHVDVDPSFRSFSNFRFTRRSTSDWIDSSPSGVAETVAGTVATAGLGAAAAVA